MSWMPYPSVISSTDILKTAIGLVESGETDGVSLRAVASALGVKVPSLYRYFEDKHALEVAVGEEILKALLVELRSASATTKPDKRFRAMVDAYLSFARKRFALYSFLFQIPHPKTEGTEAGRAVWVLLLEAASAIPGEPNDTAAVVATWSFMHGYAMLEHAGMFGRSWSKGGLERGVDTLLSSLRRRPEGVGKKPQRTATTRPKNRPKTDD